MLAKSLLAPILEDDTITRVVGDAEARMLVEWLIDEAERRAGDLVSSEQIGCEIVRLKRWGRGIAKFIQLWCYEQAHGPAIQLAASEGFGWPLPTRWLEPCELLEMILDWQDRGRFIGYHAFESHAKKPSGVNILDRADIPVGPT